MSEPKYQAPEGMLMAFHSVYTRLHASEGFLHAEAVREGFEAALRWRSENLIAPTEEQLNQMMQEVYASGFLARESVRYGAVLFQRYMFRAPEPEPEAIKDLLVNPVIGQINGKQINERLAEAYRRGKRDQTK